MIREKWKNLVDKCIEELYTIFKIYEKGIFIIYAWPFCNQPNIYYIQILENSVLQLLPENELIIEDNVIIGPGCIIHGTTIGSNSIIESGSIVCDYSKLGKNTLVKSGSLVKQRSIIIDHEIVEGFPAKNIGKNVEMQKKPAWAL